MKIVLARRKPAARERRDDLSGNTHRQLIGYIGLFLPAILVLVSGVRPTGGRSAATRRPLTSTTSGTSERSIT